MSGSFNYIVLALGLMAAGFSVWKELRRQSGKNLAWRLIASVVAISALVELIIPIQVHQPSNAGSGRQGIILTEGYHADSVRNFMAERSSSPSVIDAADFGNLKDSNFQNIHVFGFGMSEDELRPLKGLPLRFHPNPVLSGIQTADWDRKFTLGKSFRIQGQFRNEVNKPVSLVLTGTGNRLV